MVGGGEGAFIGNIHRIAAQMDGQIELVCGAFSSSATKSIESGRALLLDEQRCYPDYAAMCANEALLPETERMDLVSIVTPNHMHFPVAKTAIEAGFHVISDKPATLTLAEAIELQTIVLDSGCLYALTHTYTGYPMIKEARARVFKGELGAIRKVVVEYSQGWLADTPDIDNKQAEWRLDPVRAGASGCMGDIGVHAANLAEYVIGSPITEVCALLETKVANRYLDDDGLVALRFRNRATGVLIASQISIGEENNLTIKIIGENASLEWQQQEPNTLLLKHADRATQMLRTGVGKLSTSAVSNTRTPAGHPEGYLEAFANIYVNFAQQIRKAAGMANIGVFPQHTNLETPGIVEAVRGMAFIESVVAASKSEMKWHTIKAQGGIHV